MKKALLFFAGFFALIGIAGENPADCIETVRRAGCYVSREDVRTINRHVEKCALLRSERKAVELFLMKGTGDIMTIQVRGAGAFARYCPVKYYNVSTSGGVKDFKILGGKAFMVGYTGRLYFMESDRDFYEVLTKDDKEPYQTVTDISRADNRGVTLHFSRRGDYTMTHAEFAWRVNHGRVRHLEPRRRTTEFRLFE